MSNIVKEMMYKHLVVEGTPYEIGRTEGELLKKRYPGELDFYTNGNAWVKPASEGYAEKTMELFNRYCPYLNEEIEGFASGIGADPLKIIYYTFASVNAGNCGHFAILPNRMADRHFYVGRSYEWSCDDELTLITVKAKGTYASLGFSLGLFGRCDGMNEQGLCVTMSNAVPCVQSEEEGLRFWVAIRILLDQCKTVEEAVERLNELPISSYCNLIIADRHNRAVLAEISNAAKMYKQISPDTKDTYVCSTNHYTLEGMQGFVKNRMKQSADRYKAIVRKLGNGNMIERAELLELLSKHMPEGLACHYYEEGLGTLWSILFNITQTKAEICFGSPVLNPWRSFDFACSTGITEYRIKAPFEHADPEIWARV